MAWAIQLSPCRYARDFGRGSTLKVYLRDRANLRAVENFLAQQLPTDLPYIVLEGDICRHDLVVEIDGMHTPILAQ